MFIQERELEGMARGDLRKLYKSKGVSSGGKKEDYINRFMAAQVAGFPSKQPPKTMKERKDKYLANETSKKRRERQANDAKRHAQVRAVKRAEEKVASICAAMLKETLDQKWRYATAKDATALRQKQA